MKVHFIAIGGSAMHNLAISLCKKGYQVSGSDDEIFEYVNDNLPDLIAIDAPLNLPPGRRVMQIRSLDCKFCGPGYSCGLEAPL